MRRAAAIVVFLVGVVTFAGLGPTPAGASPALARQASCGADYPPHGPVIEPRLALTGGLLVPGTVTGTITLGGAQPGIPYGGTLYSTPVALAPAVASAGGTVTYAGLAVPAAFAVSAVHHLDVFHDCDLVGSFEFCVTTAGTISPAKACPTPTATATAGASASATSGAGVLPHTGWDHLFQILKAAALALALGAFLLYVRRRRAASASAGPSFDPTA